MLYPLEKIGYLLFFQFVIVGFYILSSYFVNKNKRKHFQSTSVILPLNGELIIKDDEIRKLIATKIAIEHFEYNIVSINTITKEVHVKVNY